LVVASGVAGGVAVGGGLTLGEPDHLIRTIYNTMTNTPALT
jgi:hypothetical protein